MVKVGVGHNMKHLKTYNEKFSFRKDDQREIRKWLFNYICNEYFGEKQESLKKYDRKIRFSPGSNGNDIYKIYKIFNDNRYRFDIICELTDEEIKDDIYLSASIVKFKDMYDISLRQTYNETEKQIEIKGIAFEVRAILKKGMDKSKFKSELSDKLRETVEHEFSIMTHYL